MSNSTVVVHGARGTQGRILTRALLDAGHVVRAVSRQPVASRPPVQSVQADLDDRASLVSAYDGADAVVVQLPLVFSARAESQAANVLEALRRARVPRAVLNAGAPLPPGVIGVPYVDARTRIADRLSEVVDVASTVSPGSPYLDNLAAPWSRPVVLEGLLRYPLPGELPLPWVSLADVATFIGQLLVATEPPRRAVLTGPAVLTGHEVAEAISVAAGRPVRWESITPEAFAATLTPHLGAEAARGVASWYDAPDGPPPAPDPASIHRGSTTVDQWAAEHWGSTQRSGDHASSVPALKEGA